MDSTMNALQWDRHPDMNSPIMIAAFEGWNDGGSASTNSVRRLIEVTQAEKFASIDPEEFYVFSENRPTVRLVEGNLVDPGTRIIDWQSNEFHHGKLPGSGQDVIFFLGTEPNLKWRTYCEHLASMAQQYQTRTVITLGAYLADVLYTLPVQVTGFTNNPTLEKRAGLERSNYEGPTGIVGVFTDHCRHLGMDTLSLWAAVPYYISIPNPKAVQSLMTKLASIFEMDLDFSGLQQDADSFDNEINDVVAKDPNVAAYVRELKKREFLN